MNIEALIEQAYTNGYLNGLRDGQGNEINMPMTTSEEIQNMIVKFVMARYDFSFDQLKSKTRKREVVFPRQLCMYLLYTFTRSNLDKIGELFGNRDHTTVIHAREMIIGLIEVGDGLSTEIIEVRKRVKDFIVQKFGEAYERVPKKTPFKKEKFIPPAPQPKRIFTAKELGLEPQPTSEIKKQTPVFVLAKRPPAEYSNAGYLSLSKKLAE